MRGMVRSHNEDAVFFNAAPMGMAILADGMGGYNAGEVASGMATTLLGSELEKAFQKTGPHQAGRLRKAAFPQSFSKLKSRAPIPRYTRPPKASPSTPAWARPW
jgi:serine/threonine protein phosphatase PrpC